MTTPMSTLIVQIYLAMKFGLRPMHAYGCIVAFEPGQEPVW